MCNFKLKKGDYVAIVSLSKGILGDNNVKHELKIGIKRLKELGLIPVFMKNALKGTDYLREHPEARAADLKQAFLDKKVKMIITSIGGNDTYKIIPFLMEDQEFITELKNNPKIFCGFSDTTINHLMLNKLGLSTFYGPAFLTDIAELDRDMLPYTKEYFLKFFGNNDLIDIRSSSFWYENRIKYDKTQIGIPRVIHEEKHGFEVLNGKGIAIGELFGGCINSIFDILTGKENLIFEKYNLLPMIDEWKNKILFLETSQVVVSPQKLKIMLLELRKKKILDSIKAVIVGKPTDEIYYEDYKDVYREIFKNSNIPVMYNVNFGHAEPRCFLQYNALATIDFDKKSIVIKSRKLLK